MKITYIEIETSSNDLRASRSLSDAFSQLLGGICGKMADSVNPPEIELAEEQTDAGEAEE